MSFFDNIFSAMLKQICGNGLYKDVEDVLSQNLFSDSNIFSNVLELIYLLYDAVMSVALMLIFIYFILAVIDKLTNEAFTWEQFVKQLVLLLVSKFVIENGLDIIELISDIGLNLFYSVAGTIEATDLINDGTGAWETSITYETFKSSMGFDGEGFFEKLLSPIAMFIVLVIPWALSFIGEMLIKLVMYSRVMEIYLRSVAAPLALADFYHGGLQSAGFRYLKTLLAFAIQGALILIITTIYSILVATVVPTGFDGLFAFFKVYGLYFAFMASAVMLMFRSITIAKEIVGTN